MPFALIGLIAMPFGLEFWPLQSWGSASTFSLPPANGWRPGRRRLRPALDLGASASAPRAWRVVALPVADALARCRPGDRSRRAHGERGGNKADVLIERDGRNVALRTEDGTLALPPATRANYSVDNWLLADGEEHDAEEVAANSPFRCDLLGCIGKVKGKSIAVVRHPAALEEDCRIADIVIAPFSVGKGCETAARVVIDRRVLQTEGAHAIYIEGCRSGAKASPRRGAEALGA